MHVSNVRSIGTYALDWVVVILVAVAGGVLNYISGFHRPFSLSDPAIAFPDKPDIVSIPVVVVVSLLAPAAIIALFSVVPLVFARKHVRDKKWRLYLWEVHVGWLGLCTALAATLFITSGLKDMIGKPRPNLLARCQPDLVNLSSYIMSGLGSTLNSEAEPIVSSKICQQTDRRLLDDSFAAFPSGHSSFSSAGMVYLSLWLFARLSLGIPRSAHSSTSEKGPGPDDWLPPPQSKQATPPSWLTAIAFVPVVVALFICSSRYADFHHAGFDIIAGALLGTLLGWTSFRLYHLSPRPGRHLFAWGPRWRKAQYSSAPLHEGRTQAADVEFGQQRGYEMNDYDVSQADRVHTGGSSDPMVLDSQHTRIVSTSPQ